MPSLHQAREMQCLRDSAFGFDPGDPGSIPCLCVTSGFFPCRLRIAALNEEGRGTLWGKPLTILKTSRWLSDALRRNKTILGYPRPYTAFYKSVYHATILTRNFSLLATCMAVSTV